MEDIAIVGAGIAGLTAAHALRHAGITVRVFERADELRAVGSGITIQANAMAALESIGLAQAVRRAGYPITEGQITDWKGRVLSQLEVGSIAEQVGHVGVALHRARLVTVLAEGLGEVITVSAGVESVRSVDGGAALELDDGTSLSFQAVIGCDGLHSIVRRSLFGEVPLRYAGYTTWRGIAEMPAREIPLTEMWGPGRRFGLVPIAEDQVYWFAVDTAAPGEPSTEPLIDEVRPLFDGWSPTVSRALDRTDPGAIIRTDCHDLPPRDVWGAERVTLVGDAIHPMTPNLGQGGGQAIESAVVLGRVLARTSDLSAGLRRYEALRRERAHHFVKQSWKFGRIAQVKNPLARGLRDLGLRLTPRSFGRRLTAELYDFEGWYEGAR